METLKGRLLLYHQTKSPSERVEKEDDLDKVEGEISESQAETNSETHKKEEDLIQRNITIDIKETAVITDNQKERSKVGESGKIDTYPSRPADYDSDGEQESNKKRALVLKQNIEEDLPIYEERTNIITIVETK